ncbi:hypothetical protein CLAIMM_13899 [Cladophialophora immunda]|nr:hypothetical protein CLAIMM_13899 [Cladophialophora immunda]
MPGLKLQIFEALFGTQVSPSNLRYLGDYFAFYVEEIGLLGIGIGTQARQAARVAATTHEDIMQIARAIRVHADGTRQDLQRVLRGNFADKSENEIENAINLGIRLSLLVNVRDKSLSSLRSSTPCVVWAADVPLKQFLTSLFPVPRYTRLTAKESRLDPKFTATNMVRICGLRIRWTTSLEDHLSLDRRTKTLSIFPHKFVLQAMLGIGSGSKQHPVPLPHSMLAETILTLDLLFPPWDRDTEVFLEAQGQAFHQIGEFDAHRTLNLWDFVHWRDRVLELYEEVFQSPPVSWAQLWRDRRNPQQFWTFWIALFILGLTIVSCVATMVQTWAAVKAIGRQRS